MYVLGITQKPVRRRPLSITTVITFTHSAHPNRSTRQP
jgi:hypothetical protein